jgi:hypothetical protein
MTTIYLIIPQDELLAAVLAAAGAIVIILIARFVLGFITG